MTLIEVMIGITILTTALLPIMGFFINQTRLTYESGLRSEALQLAQQAMEEIKATEFNRLETKAAEKTESISPFDRQVVLDDYQAAEDLKKITITISWGQTKSLQLQTLLASR
ncbi:type IV pilus modification PilV family protein [Halanaerobaculum tunisiense]